MSSYAERISVLPFKQKLRFYERLAHALTVSMRAIGSDSELDDAQKVDQMKWINEASHRVTAKISVLRLTTREWTDAAVMSELQWAAMQCPGISGHLGYAVRTCYEGVADDNTQPEPG
jgi:hypothetical protein